MTRDIADDLEPDMPEEVLMLAERLQRERPVPAVSFRGELRRRLVAGGAGRARPRRLRLLIAGYATAGSLLLAIAAVSAAGVGPLGA